ncbi:MAG: hypothetical protein ACOX5Z_03210 [Desulfobulbus sp.]|jgi:hypothetical protein
MVDIIIGAIEPIRPEFNKPQTGAPVVTAELLHIREPRQRVLGPVGTERRKQQRRDPANGKVLTLMIDDATLLPHDLDVGRYKVLLRFMKK